MHSQTRTQTKTRGEILDPSTAAALRAYIGRAGWRTACVELRSSERTMRSVLAGRPILHGSAVVLRLALSGLEPQPETTP